MKAEKYVYKECHLFEWTTVGGGAYELAVLLGATLVRGFSIVKTAKSPCPLRIVIHNSSSEGELP